MAEANYRRTSFRVVGIQKSRSDPSAIYHPCVRSCPPTPWLMIVYWKQGRCWEASSALPWHADCAGKVLWGTRSQTADFVENNSTCSLTHIVCISLTFPAHFISSALNSTCSHTGLKTMDLLPPLLYTTIKAWSSHSLNTSSAQLHYSLPELALSWRPGPFLQGQSCDRGAVGDPHACGWSNL